MDRLTPPRAEPEARPAPPLAVRRPAGNGRVASEPERPLLEQLARMFPVGVIIGIAWAIAWKTFGSIAARDWLPYALLAALVLAGAIVSTGRARPNRLTGGALAALVGFAAFTALSLTWAPLPSLARDEALLVLFYAIALAVTALTVRTSDDRLFACGAVALGAVTLTLAMALKIRSTAHPADLFLGGRLDFPITYINAQAAAMLVGFWPAIVVATKRSAAIWLRSLAVGGATALLAGWLLTQSKGGAFGLVISAAVVFSVSSTRLRIAVPVLIASVLTVLGAAPLTAPIRASSNSQLANAVHRGGTVLLLLFVGGCIAGAGYVLADRRLRVPGHIRELAGRIALAGVGLAVTIGFALLIAHHPGKLWHDFKRQPNDRQPAAGTHLLSLGSNRYDFWRVALSEFEKHPIVGVGAHGFGTVYLQHRSSGESPVHAHSLEADTLSETGLVGFGLLGGALGLLLLGAGRRARVEPAAAGALGGAVYLLAHASVDWIWSFPAIGLPLFVLLGAGASSGARRAQRFGLAAGAGVAAAVVGLAAIAFAPPWLSVKYNDRALKGGPGATSDARTARRLDPLSVEPLLTESQLASTPLAALQSLRLAVGKEPRAYDLHYVLALGYRRAGLIASARRELLIAHRLNPLDPIVASTLRKLQRRA